MKIWKRGIVVWTYAMIMDSHSEWSVVKSCSNTYRGDTRSLLVPSFLHIKNSRVINSTICRGYPREGGWVGGTFSSQREGEYSVSYDALPGLMFSLLLWWTGSKSNRPPPNNKILKWGTGTESLYRVN